MLRSFREVRQQQASTKFRRGDVALLQEDVRPRHMWKRALIEQLIEGRDGMIRTVVLRTPEGNKITRPIQLVIPLEVDQGGEDVEERLSSKYNVNATATGSSVSICKFFANIVCVNQDVVLWTNPLVATPNKVHRMYTVSVSFTPSSKPCSVQRIHFFRTQLSISAV